MKKIKSYNDFHNEEINIKKTIAGAALGASLAFGSCGSPHCGEIATIKAKSGIHTGVVISENDREITIKTNTSLGQISIPKYEIIDVSYKSKDEVDINKKELINKNAKTTIKVFYGDIPGVTEILDRVDNNSKDVIGDFIRQFKVMYPSEKLSKFLKMGNLGDPEVEAILREKSLNTTIK